MNVSACIDPGIMYTDIFLDVQWLRGRFNECFDKAEYAKGRLVGDIPDAAMLAEKLIFDRALEMVSVASTVWGVLNLLTGCFRAQSRAAAVSELMGENTQECEIAYDTALWMLYAILDETMQEGELVDEEDTVTVRNCKFRKDGMVATPY